MHQSPPPHPSHRTALTEPLPARAPRTSFYLTVGCLSVIAGLVLGVGGFFGVRALQHGGGISIAGGGSDGGGDEQGTETTPPTFDEMPVGPEDAVPFGSTFPFHSTTLGADVDVTVTAMDWDATSEILEANSLNAEPEEGNKYVLLTLEGLYHDDSDYPSSLQVWMRAVYIAEDGTEHSRAFVVTPHYDDLLEQRGVTAGGTFLSELAFELPAEVEGGGHFVLLDDIQVTEEGAWMAAS